MTDRPAGTLVVSGLSLDLPLPGRWPRRTLRALDGIDLAVAPGEILGIVGESGSGKTTLGKTLARLHAPTEGSLRFDDGPSAPPAALGRLGEARRLQMVFQDPLSSFNPRRRVGAALHLALDLHGIGLPGDRSAAVDGLLEAVGLTPGHGARYPHELSGGQLQRVALARALAVRPDVIVADEAVSKLDVSVRAQVLNLVKRTNAATGVAFVFITHDLAVARFLCHRVAVMYFGRIVEIGPARAVLGEPRHPYTARLVAAKGGSEPPRAPGRDPRGLGADACQYRASCERASGRCGRERPNLVADGAACFHPLARACAAVAEQPA
jgi:ABC-type glutathione transport system ATPase component